VNHVSYSPGFPLRPARRSIVLVVYAADSIDIDGAGWSRGGPYRFIREAIVAVSRGARVHRGCLSRHGAMFSHRELYGLRVSRLLRAPSRCLKRSSLGDAALVSPIYWELSVEDAAEVARSGYRVVVFDLQGFTRFSAGGLVVTLRYSLQQVQKYLESIASSATPGAVFKASLEDLGFDLYAAAQFLEGAVRGLSVLTLGASGVCFSWKGRCAQCRPFLGDASLPAIGAGDVFAAYLALLLAQGMEVDDAVCGAVHFTEVFLAKRAGRSRVIGSPVFAELPGCESCLSIVASSLGG